MAEFYSPIYVLDLRDRSNCSRIEHARPGEEMWVLVRPVDDPAAQSIIAKGMLSQDGASFSVAIPRSDGVQHSPTLDLEASQASTLVQTCSLRHG
jgi:hypothetical protein